MVKLKLGHVYLSSKTYVTKISVKEGFYYIHFCFFPYTNYRLPIHPAIAAIHRVQLDLHSAVLKYILPYAFNSRMNAILSLFLYCNTQFL